MNVSLGGAATRRNLLKAGLAFGGVAIAPTVLAAGRYHDELGAGVAPLPAAPIASYPGEIRPDLLRAALRSFERHGDRLRYRDRIAIADFAAPSAAKRFHLFNVESGETTSFLVAHGSGSDPDHSGWVKRLSNDPGSNASCQGAFLADDYYIGKHGRSQRLVGLDPTNDNTLARAIVIHSAWYSNDAMLQTHGMLGRSQGCFAVGEAHLDQVFALLGPGRLLYADKA
jgi:hypothetical protein